MDVFCVGLMNIVLSLGKSERRRFKDLHPGSLDIKVVF